MPRKSKREQTRQRLLEDGVAAFLEHGYHGTGIKEVLDRVKVPKGSFYNYFENKEEFGAAAIRHYANCLAGKMESSLSGASDPVSGLRNFFERLMAEFEDSNFVGGCLIANLGGELEGSDVCRRALSESLDQWREGIYGALKQGQELSLIRTDMEAGAMADLLAESWEGAVIRMKIDRSLQPLHRCLDLLLDDYFRP